MRDSTESKLTTEARLLIALAALLAVLVYLLVSARVSRIGFPLDDATKHHAVPTQQHPCDGFHYLFIQAFIAGLRCWPSLWLSVFSPWPASRHSSGLWVS